MRDLLLREHPEVFSVPARFARHMVVVADLAGEGAVEPDVEDALESAWRWQCDPAD